MLALLYFINVCETFAFLIHFVIYTYLKHICFMLAHKPYSSRVWLNSGTSARLEALGVVYISGMVITLNIVWWRSVFRFSERLIEAIFDTYFNQKQRQIYLTNNSAGSRRYWYFLHISDMADVTMWILDHLSDNTNL